MHKVVLALLLLSSFLTRAQVVPREGAALNYRIIVFRFPKTEGVLEIAKGMIYNADSFKRSIIVSMPVKGSTVTAIVPAFGKDYTWRTMGSKSDRLHHFRTLSYEYSDTAKSRLRIINSNGKYDDMYIIVDRAMTLYNMKGEPLWFIPNIGGGGHNKGGPRDIKLTPQGTVTFLVDDDVHELNYDGKLLWKGPNDGKVSSDTAEIYHHEFTRLPNGHYMVLGTAHVAIPLPAWRTAQATDTARNIFKDKDGTFRQKLEFGTVIEYDNKGRVLWSWNSYTYFKNSEIFNHYQADGSLPVIDVHENAFYFDEQKKVIYVGFKNISRILKIKYPEGTTLAAYGNTNETGNAMMCSDDFCGQHSISLTSDGALMIFNNNSSSFANLPQALLLKEEKDRAYLTKIWSFDCSLDGINESEIEALSTKDKQMQKAYTPDQLRGLAMNVSPGGNITELPGHTYFIAAGGRFGKMYIVNQQKEILWSAILELKVFEGAPWTTQGTYRASIITKEDLQKFIRSAR